METSTDLITLADQYAESAHNGQVRRYTGEPYVTHLRAVAGLVASVHGHTPQMIAAALLHDVLEDTDVSYDELELVFGYEVAQMVYHLTDQYTEPFRGNRAKRKALEAERLSQTPAEVQTIKVADLIDNCKSIVEHDPGFARVYMAEKKRLLSLLTRADPMLRQQAQQLIDAYYQEEQ